MEEQITEQPSLTDVLKEHHPGEHPCGYCDRVFKSMPALRMHKVRAHGKGWDTSRNFGKRNLTQHEKKLQYQRNLRARYKREGKDSRGYPKKTGAHKWGPEQLHKFRRTMKRKAMAKAGANLFEAGGNKKTKRSIQIIYPDPSHPFNQDEPELADVHVPQLKFCPNCGEHLVPWKHTL